MWPTLPLRLNDFARKTSRSPWEPSAMARTMRLRMSAFMANLLGSMVSSVCHRVHPFASTNCDLTFDLTVLAFRARAYRQPSACFSALMSCPRSLSALTQRDTVGIDTPISSASMGVEYLARLNQTEDHFQPDFNFVENAGKSLG